MRVATRDGAAGYAQTITDADPEIRQAADRWHLWKLLAEAARKEAVAHSACWAAVGLLPKRQTYGRAGYPLLRQRILLS